jgi:hypothetical protein
MRPLTLALMGGSPALDFDHPWQADGQPGFSGRLGTSETAKGTPQRGEFHSLGQAEACPTKKAGLQRP